MYELTQDTTLPESMKILFIQHEFPDKLSTKPWGFWIHLGLVELLRMQQHDVTIVFSKDLIRFRHQLSCERYDIGLINDVVHGFGGQSATLGQSEFDTIRAICSEVVGIFLEPVFWYRNASGALESFAVDRLKKISPFLHSFDKFMLSDIRDLDYLPQRKSFLLQPYVFKRHMVEDVGGIANKIRKTIFIGTINPKRESLIKTLSHSPWFVAGRIADEDERFWDYYMACYGSYKSVDFRFYDRYASSLAFIREQAFVHYLRVIGRFSSLVHLPTFFEGFHERVLNALAAGIIPVVPESPLLKALGFADRENCIFFRAGCVESLQNSISVANADESNSGDIVRNGRKLIEEKFSERIFGQSVSRFLID